MMKMIKSIMQIIRNTSKLLQTKGWLNWWPVQMKMKAKMKAKGRMNSPSVQMKTKAKMRMRASPSVIHAVLFHNTSLLCFAISFRFCGKSFKICAVYKNFVSPCCCFLAGKFVSNDFEDLCEE